MNALARTHFLAHLLAGINKIICLLSSFSLTCSLVFVFELVSICVCVCSVVVCLLHVYIYALLASQCPSLGCLEAMEQLYVSDNARPSTITSQQSPWSI